MGAGPLPPPPPLDVAVGDERGEEESLEMSRSSAVRAVSSSSLKIEKPNELKDPGSFLQADVSAVQLKFVLVAYLLPDAELDAAAVAARAEVPRGWSGDVVVVLFVGEGILGYDKGGGSFCGLNNLIFIKLI